MKIPSEVCTRTQNFTLKNKKAPHRGREGETPLPHPPPPPLGRYAPSQEVFRKFGMLPVASLFFETPPVFHWFFANVNAHSPLTGIFLFGFLVTWNLTFCGITRDVLRTMYGQR